MARQYGGGQNLSIQQVFLLLAVLNGFVLGYLILSAWEVIRTPGSTEVNAYTTFYLALLLVIGVAISYQIISRRVVNPLRRLVRATYAIAFSPDKATELLTVDGGDEVGKLVEAFNTLLQRQRQAMAQLDDTNRELRAANKQVDDSIRYAALLQRSILPDRQISERFGDDHFVIWKPRDIVGGDYYLFHEDGDHCLIGIADCAGHGVPGAMMTMLARAGLDRSIQQVGIRSPARVLQTMNADMGDVLSEAQRSRVIATSMDAGMVYLDFEARLLRFSGARISLYWSDAQSMQVVNGDSCSLWSRRIGSFHDHAIPMVEGGTYYLTTDGLLDQAGGHRGFGLGREGFQRLIQQTSAEPLPKQAEAIHRAILHHMGDHPQRDDITMLAFRLV
ncbi:bacterial signal domain protein [Cyanobium sp. PCC 7001]|uniref:SpoIIE family protein phosphatase n=1 Tax=Cyanobium sp. PCC 7001 TaxID=180281 RepID=UPI0001805BF2|nr:SpoIIE family protein phosphatase [Cyanobium sp. PCC 7001]EDY38680.1 bacterial signal domain protein [Cyanobium sp. PCC 7001]